MNINYDLFVGTYTQNTLNMPAKARAAGIETVYRIVKFVTIYQFSKISLSEEDW
jgi:hypothetical protein